MDDFRRVLQYYNGTLEKVLSHKTDRAVLQVYLHDGKRRILRVYSQVIPCYQWLSNHSNPCLPKVFGTVAFEDCFAVEEEYIDGIPLMDMIEGGARMDEIRTCKIAHEVCMAADLLHKSGFIHRDIKPEHVMLTPDGRVVLMDLDASMRISMEKNVDTQLLGTAMYAAPEQFGLSRSDARTDIYAMGMLINEMLTGAHPAVIRYESGPLAEVISRCIQMNPARPLSEYGAACEALHRVKVQNENRISKSKQRSNCLRKRKKLGTAIVLTISVLIGSCLMPGILGKEQNPEANPDSAIYSLQSAAEHVAGAGSACQQLYKDYRTIYYNFRFGSQAAQLWLPDGTLVDQTFHVCVDEQVGRIEGWSEKYEGWRLNSVGCEMGTSGYLHAEKNGKHYFIEVVVMGEPLSVYTAVPDMKNLAQNYLKAKEDGLTVSLSYNTEEPCVLYLASMDGFYDLDPTCSSELVNIRPYKGAPNWPYPLFEMTFENPDGGDETIEIITNQFVLNCEFEEVEASDNQPFVQAAMEGPWLQMYKYDCREDFAQVHRDGQQSARYYTEDGTLIDDTYHVYCDKQVGEVVGWLPELQHWDINSQGCDAGAVGYLHAEKDGKHYAIDVRVLGESMSAYTSLPNYGDIRSGYLQSEQQDGISDTYTIEYTYRRDEPTVLYLAAMLGMDELFVHCNSPLVSIEPNTEPVQWNEPIYKMTFENPAGGDVQFEVTSNMNPLTFVMKEEQSGR